MSRVTLENEARLSRPAGDEWRERYHLTDRPAGLSPGLLLVGVAAVGLGVLASYYLLPDLVRYMKIRDM
jgi:hypothetical protein